MSKFNSVADYYAEYPVVKEAVSDLIKRTKTAFSGRMPQIRLSLCGFDASDAADFDARQKEFAKVDIASILENVNMNIVGITYGSLQHTRSWMQPLHITPNIRFLGDEQGCAGFEIFVNEILPEWNEHNGKKLDDAGCFVNVGIEIDYGEVKNAGRYRAA
ncbi:MAG: hypothetical protein M1276_00540 [Deltaproteobacteria bacterium]|jgi:hypothetical protein|nr:hypothetical protein [Deltaproteobacteria bacterium]